MKLTLAAVLGLAVFAAPVAFAEPGPAEGQGLYEARCKMCHGTGMGGAPLADKMAGLDAPVVVEKLTTGTMAAMASGLSETDKRDVAVFLTKKGLPAKDGLPEVKPAS